MKPEVDFLSTDVSSVRDGVGRVTNDQVDYPLRIILMIMMIKMVKMLIMLMIIIIMVAGMK